MAIVSACPDVSALQKLALGCVLPHEVERLARHCEQCSRCIGVLHSLNVKDSLIETMAAQSTAPNRAFDDAVTALIERLQQMPSPALAEVEMTATVAGGDTPSALAAAGEFIENTHAGDVSLGPPQSADEIGRLGGYRVLKLLGTGGMGMVYLAEDVQLQRPIALKIMKAELAQNPDNRERFLREARAAAKLKSDYVVNIYQVGEERQIVFLAMEFLEGMSLAELLLKGCKPTLAQAAHIGRQIALGLADAHACGLIHRDIKPGNIWLDTRHQGRIKLLDFGLARAETEETQLTQYGAIVGTPAYMAPEQARSEKVDHRADLFSLGVVLYRLTTGQMPFRGDNTMSVLTALAVDTPTPPRQINAAIPQRMAALIECLLCKEREKRPATAKAVAEELAAVEREASQPEEEDCTVQVRAVRRSERATPPAPLRSRLRWLVAASLLLLSGIAAAAIVVIVRDKQGNEIAKINVPEGGSAEIKDQGEAKASLPPKADARRAAAPLAPLLFGEPLSPMALVQRPAKLSGLRSWSIATRIGSQGMTAVAYRPDGGRLAVGTSDGHVRIWEPQTGRLVQVLFCRNPVLSLSWSHDGRVLATGSQGERVVLLWEAESGRLLLTLETSDETVHPFSAIHALGWSSDGRNLLAYASHSWDCFAWNSADGKFLGKVPIPPGNYPVFSPDGKRLAQTGVVPDTVCIYDVRTGKEVRRLTGHKAATAPLRWSPDGKRIACAAPDGVRVWDAQTGREIRHHQGYGGAYVDVVWSPDGRAVALSPLNRSEALVVVEIAEGANPLRLDEIGAYTFLDWSPDGKQVVAAGDFGVRLCDSATGKRLRTLSEDVSAWAGYALSSNGQSIATQTGLGETILSSADTGQVFVVLKNPHGPLAWSPDGKNLATKGGKGIAIWDSTGKLRLTMAAHPQGVDSLAWSPDGKRLASSSNGEKHLLLWDTEEGERLRELGPFAGAPTFLRWSRDGRMVAFKVAEVGWHVWDVEQNKLANDPKKWQGDMFDFAPDGRAALIRSDWDFRLRNLHTGSELSPPITSKWPVYDTPSLLSADGCLLAAPVGANIEMLRTHSGRRVRTLKGTQSVARAAFSADGKRMAGLSGDRLHIWETDTGRLRGILLLGEKNNGLTLTHEGHYTGNEQVDHGIVMVVQKEDGAQEVLEPTEFEQKYGWKNEPDKVHLSQPLPPPLYALPGTPMGSNALVHEPSELPDANALSWTIETINARGQVKAVVYRPDGKLLATGGYDGAIRIWDPTKGKLVRMLIGDAVESLSWSKDGKILAAGGDRATLLWEIETGRLCRRLSFGGNLGWSPNENILAILDGNGILSLWEASSERVVRTYAFQHQGKALTWSPDGKTLALGLANKRIRLWDVASAKEVRELEGHQSPEVCGIAWSPDGKRLVTTSLHERKFFIWDAASGKLLGRFPVEAPWETPSTLAWTPDGKAVFIGTLGLFDPDTGHRIGSFDANDSIRHLAAWPADFKQTATFGDQGVRLHDTVTGKRTHTLEEGARKQDIMTLAWSPDSCCLALRCIDERYNQVVEAATGRPRPVPTTDGWKAAALSPDRRVWAIQEGSAVRLRDANSLPLGVLLPLDGFGRLAVTVDGRYRGNARLQRLIRMVVQKRDGTSETLTPSEFKQKYGWKNEPDKVRLIDK